MQVIEIFPWNESFKTGVLSIDLQHKRLVELINLLACHLSSRSDAPTLNALFDELADYAVYHFREEEAIWYKYLPEDALELEHKHTHGSFVAEILSLKVGEEGQSTDLVIEGILKFLTHWLVCHILENDMRMSKIVLAVQAGKTLQQAKDSAHFEMNGAMSALVGSILTMYDGITAQTLALMKEVVARQNAEDKLLLAGKAIESTLDAVCITDADFNIVDVNPSFYESTEFNYDEIVGQNLRVLKPELNGEKFSVMLNKLNANGHWIGEVKSPTKDIPSKVELLTLSSAKDAHGIIKNYIAIFSKNRRLSGDRVSQNGNPSI